MSYNNNLNTGVYSPTSNYEESVSEMFPSLSKRYKIDGSIESRYDRDYLPVNCNVFNGSINDNFLEFRVSGADGEFLDLSTLALEVKMGITNADGTALDDTDNLTLADGLFHNLFKSHSVYLNGTQVEGNSYFGLCNNIKVYTQMRKSNLCTLGRNMYYKDLINTIPEKITDAYFSTASDDEKTIMKEIKTGVHAMGPLLLDISDADCYLLDRIDMRLRLELSPAAAVILTSNSKQYKYNIKLCKLWLKVIKPMPSALLALNKLLIETNKSIEYVFNKPLVKTVIFPANHVNLIIENPFNSVIPKKIYIFIIDQQALNGSYKLNPNYLMHNNVNNIKVEINGNTLSNLNCDFTSAPGSVFYQTVKTIGNNNLLTHTFF